MMALHQLVWSQVTLPCAAGLSKDQNGRPVGSGTAEERLTAYSRWYSFPGTICISFIFLFKKKINTSLERFCAPSFSMHSTHNAEQLSNIRWIFYNKVR